MTTTLPQAGERYEHFKGGLYEVVCTAVEESVGTKLVIYRSLADGRTWARPLLSFWQQVTWKDSDGKIYQCLRFTPQSEVKAEVEAEPEGRSAGRLWKGNAS